MSDSTSDIVTTFAIRQFAGSLVPRGLGQSPPCHQKPPHGSSTQDGNPGDNLQPCFRF